MCNMYTRNDKSCSHHYCSPSLVGGGLQSIVSVSHNVKKVFVFVYIIFAFLCCKYLHKTIILVIYYKTRSVFRYQNKSLFFPNRRERNQWHLTKVFVASKNAGITHHWAGSVFSWDGYDRVPTFV